MVIAKILIVINGNITECEELIAGFFLLDIVGQVFLHRMMNAWNALCCGADTTMALQRLPVKHLLIQGMEGSGLCAGEYEMVYLDVAQWDLEIKQCFC